MENLGNELADQQMGGGMSGMSGTGAGAGAATHDESHSDSTGVPTVDNSEAVESVDSVGSGVEPPELLPAHEIASEIAARPESTDGDVDEVDEEVDNCDADDQEDVSDVVTVPVTTGMIDATDFRGVLSEPTYQTLNGRMTPPGFTTSSSYATLTPLQPLPPISTMSDKFTHHYGHPGNGGFALMHMQNAASLGMNHNQYQYDKTLVGPAMVSTAMAAAGIAIEHMSPTLGVAPGHHHHHHHVTAAAIINTNGGIHSHSGGIPSPPYPSNGLHSPDKSLSPTNGYDYTLRQGSPQSPSSVNLHSPTSLMPALNGLPTSPPSSHIPSPPPAQVSSMSSVPITVSGVLTSGTSVTAPQQTVSHSNHGPQHVKVATTLTAAPQPITVLQAVTPTPAAIAPTAQTVTIVQAATAGISNLATTIVSTPVAVVTSANALHQQHQQLNQIKQHQINIGGANSSKQANQAVSQTSSSASNNGADDIEEINTKDLAQRISAELKRYSIPQAIFAQRVLCRSQGTLSDLLRNPKPWSKLKSGRETFRRMQKWLEEPEFQRMSALRLAGKSFEPTALLVGTGPSALVTSDAHFLATITAADYADNAWSAVRHHSADRDLSYSSHECKRIPNVTKLLFNSLIVLLSIPMSNRLTRFVIIYYYLI